MEKIVFYEDSVMYSDNLYLDLKGVITAYERGDMLSEIKEAFDFKADIYTLSYIINKYISENSIKYVKTTRISNISPEKIYELNIKKKINFSELVLEYDVSRTTLKEKKLDVYCKEHNINLKEIRNEQLIETRKNKLQNSEESIVTSENPHSNIENKYDIRSNPNPTSPEAPKKKNNCNQQETRLKFPKTWVKKFIQQPGNGYSELVDHAQKRGYYIPEDYKTEFFGTEFTDEHSKKKDQEEILKNSRQFVTDKLNDYFHNTKTKDTNPDLVQKYVEDIFRISIKLNAKNIGIKERIVSLLYSLSTIININNQEILELIQNDEETKSAIEVLTNNNIDELKNNPIAKNVILALKLEELENPLTSEASIIWADYIPFYEMAKGTEFEEDYKRNKIKYNKEKNIGPSLED